MNDGPLPLLLLPGLLCDEALWEHQVRHLSDVARPRVADLTVGGTVAAMADAVLASAPERFALAGLSMGGYVALEIVRRVPERVDRLALLDTNAHADPAEARERRLSLIALAAEGRLGEAVDRMLPTLVHPDRLGNGTMAEAVHAMARRIGPGPFVRQQRAIMDRPDGRPGLPHVRCPALVVCGRQDALSGVAEHAAMASAIPGGRLAVIEDCGHLSSMEQPQAVTALLRQWLTHD